MGTSDEYFPLFETRRAKRTAPYRVFAATIFVGICLVWAYRLSHVPAAGSWRWTWLGLFGTELWIGLYWVVTQSFRWNMIYRRTFKERLSQRFDDNELPGVDIFVCTADPILEPPLMVMNTVLSVMALDYPTEKLAVYLSDDAGSDLTFYALLEASSFARHWLPYCKRFKVEPTSPSAYFASLSDSPPPNGNQTNDLLVALKKLYKQMEVRIDSTMKLGRVSEEERSKNAGFSQWESYTSRKDHDTILDIVIDGEDDSGRDVDGVALPTLVYLAREKRHQHHHNFKAGAMNSLIRVSSKISNGPIILNVDCDMYCNNSQSIRDALCFFMDERQSHQIAFVQFPQSFENVTRNDVYGNCLRIIFNVDCCGMDGGGGPPYDGTGCFHRRDILCGKKFSKDDEIIKPWKKKHMDDQKHIRSVQEVEEQVKPLARCTYEHNTLWGSEMGLRYGCLVEDFVTGLWIQSNGWKSACMNPTRSAFLGLAPTTLLQTLVQHQRWSEGNFQILTSKFSPFWHSKGRISISLKLAYLASFLWTPSCLPTLYYSIVPSLYLLKGVSLFPQVSSPWFFPFMYVVLAKYIYSLIEFRNAGGTVSAWWNEQRMYQYKRTSSFLFSLINTILKLLGMAESVFVITSKVADDEAEHRYQEEIVEFGASSPMFTILSTLALLNLFCLVGAAKKAVMDELEIPKMALQLFLCAVLVVINLPLYQGLFLRTDKGRMPTPVTIKSIGLAFLACVSFSCYYGSPDQDAKSNNLLGSHQVNTQWNVY